MCVPDSLGNSSINYLRFSRHNEVIARTPARPIVACTILCAFLKQLERSCPALINTCLLSISNAINCALMRNYGGGHSCKLIRNEPNPLLARPTPVEETGWWSLKCAHNQEEAAFFLDTFWFARFDHKQSLEHVSYLQF